MKQDGIKTGKIGQDFSDETSGKKEKAPPIRGALFSSGRLFGGSHPVRNSEDGISGLDGWATPNFHPSTFNFQLV
jgi:hypothetical protein